MPLPRSRTRQRSSIDSSTPSSRAISIAVVALLTDDARLKMPPEPFEFHGPRPIAEFLQQLRFWGEDLKMVPTRANSDPAFGYYRKDPNADVYRASGIFVLTVSRGPDLFDDAVRRQEPLRLLRPATHRTQSLAAHWFTVSRLPRLAETRKRVSTAPSSHTLDCVGSAAGVTDSAWAFGDELTPANPVALATPLRG